MKAVILAGGSGERFWPLSTPENPKQFLKIFDGKSLLRMTFERLSMKLSTDDIFVISHEMYDEKISREIPELSHDNLLFEPEKKNTAPAIVYSSLVVPDGEIMLVVPADHYIPDPEDFWKVVERAEGFLKSHPRCLLTFGVVPTRPETGYGYIERGEEVEKGVYKVKRFREKPSYEVAEEFLESGNFYWNSGMFMWYRETFLREMEAHSPDVLKPILEKGREGYEDVPSISIDYALMEKSDSICVVEAEFEWSDVGNWKSLEEIGYGSDSNVVAVESENIYVLSRKPVLVVGVSDVVIAESENGLLVANKKDLELIREGVRKILSKSNEDLH